MIKQCPACSSLAIGIPDTTGRTICAECNQGFTIRPRARDITPTDPDLPRGFREYCAVTRA